MEKGLEYQMLPKTFSDQDWITKLMNLVENLDTN